jgi:hypothetical protein
MELDPRIKIIAIILIILFIVSGIPIGLIKNHFNPKPVVNLTEENKTIIVYETIEVFVTPIPDGITYFVSEYQNGIRKIQRPFSFISLNALGLKDMVVHSQVYDYKVFNSYHWFNPTEYKYYKQRPSDGNKFVFVFYNIYLDDIQGSDTSYWIPTEGSLNLQSEGMTYAPLDFPKQIRIKELEETWNLNSDSRVGAFNAVKAYSRSTEFTDTAGETFTSVDVIRGGLSNRVDGYFIFEIPANIPDEQLLFACNYGKFGDAFWRLKP